MSGIDEQIRDIPICPICGNIPYFWVLYPNIQQDIGNGWYWLFSDAYLERNVDYTKLMAKEGYHKRSPTLDDIVSILCGNTDNHAFTANHPVFRKVIQNARKLEG